MVAKKVLVLDGMAPSSLAITRSLGRKGLHIHVGEVCKPNIASYSKYVKKYVRYSSPMDNPEYFVKDLIEIVKQEKYDALIPATEETTLLISKNMQTFQNYTNVFLAEYDTLHQFADKGKTVKFANKLNIPTPKTYFQEDTDIETIKQNIEYPVLIRPRISSGSRGIKKVKNSSEFDAVYKEIKSEYGEPIIQEFIKKTGYSTACILLDDKQNEVASFTYERVKEYPLNGGPTVVGISTSDSFILRSSLKLLKKAKWKGVAEVEFILNENGKPLLLEVNPRFWTPVNLAIDSGVDFPHLLYQLIIGKRPSTVNSYQIGVKYRWVLPMELLWLLNSPDKVKGMKEFLDFSREKSSFGILSWDDPMPVLGSLAQSLDFILDSKKRKMVLGR